jgi:hypothetical protein
LLAEYIRTKEGIEPILIPSWPPPPNPYRAQLRGQWAERLPSTYDPEGPNTIIIDEAQSTHWDTVFWNNFLQEITPESSDRVILFASYGSPTGRVSAEGTSMVAPDHNRVSLRPVYHSHEVPPLPSAGLLLTVEEFTDMVGRAYKAGCFDNDFLEYVFRVTAGHTGAVADLLTVVSSHDVSLRVKLQHSLIIVSSRTVSLRRKTGRTHWKSLRPNFLSKRSGRVS